MGHKREPAADGLTTGGTFFSYQDSGADFGGRETNYDSQMQQQESPSPFKSY